MRIEPTGENPADVHTAQREVDDFPINRELLKTMQNIAGRSVRRTDGGFDILAPAVQARGGSYGSRMGRRPRLLWAAGLAVLGGDGVWALTPAGVRRTVQMVEHYASLSVTAGK